MTATMNQPSPRSSERWVLAISSIASLMVALDLLVVATALDTIRRSLEAPVDALQWVVTGYALSFASLLMPGAALGDRFGRRRVFLIGVAAFTVASIACALAPSVGWLIAARIVQGAAAALVLPLALALLTATYSRERRARAIGMLEGISGIAVIAGPVLGGIIAHSLSWHWIFWINVPIGILLLLAGLRFAIESRGASRALDLAGIALVAGSGFAFVWGLVRARDGEWMSLEVLFAIAAGVLLAAIFVWRERTAREPMLPMDFFRRRGFSAGIAASVFLFGSLYGGVFFFAQFFQTGLGFTPAEAGLGLLPWTAPLFFVAPIAGALAAKVGTRRLLVIGMVLQTAGMGWFALAMNSDVTYGKIVAALVVSGIGVSTCLPVVQNAILAAVPESGVGTAAGANNAAQEFGGALGVAILVAAFGTSGGYESAAQFIDGFSVALWASTALAALGLAAAAFVPSREQPT